MFKMCWNINIGDWTLALLEGVEIHKSVDLIAGTAVITVPASVYNRTLSIEDKVKVGDSVVVQLGYDDNLVTEFEGYLQRIDTDGNSITFNCEDGAYLTRKPVPNTVLTMASVQDIAEYCAGYSGLSLNCTYNAMVYEQFVIKDANAYDVLKKLQQETGANIYTKGNVLHVHPAYVKVTGRVSYDFAVNVEKADLKYRNADDRKFEVSVEGIGLDGKRKTVTIGTTGGEKRSIKVYNVASEAELRARGEEEMKYLSYSGYEGSITGWLVPFAEPGYSVSLHDAEYEYKDGTYYAVSVTTSMSADGGARKVELGVRL